MGSHSQQGLEPGRPCATLEHVMQSRSHKWQLRDQDGRAEDGDNGNSDSWLRLWLRRQAPGTSVPSPVYRERTSRLDSPGHGRLRLQVALTAVGSEVAQHPPAAGLAYAETDSGGEVWGDSEGCGLLPGSDTRYVRIATGVSGLSGLGCGERRAPPRWDRADRARWAPHVLGRVLGGLL